MKQSSYNVNNLRTHNKKNTVTIYKINGLSPETKQETTDLNDGSQSTECHPLGPQ